MMAQDEGPVLQFRLQCRVCVQSLCGVFFFQRTPPFKTLEYHLLVLHTPGLVRSQLCSAAQQLGQQLTHVAASPSYISAFRKQLSNISFILCSLMSHIWAMKDMTHSNARRSLAYDVDSMYCNLCELWTFRNKTELQS